MKPIVATLIKEVVLGILKIFVDSKKKDGEKDCKSQHECQSVAEKKCESKK